MKFDKENVMNAFDILTCRVEETDVLGSECKKEVKEVLDDYFNKRERKRVVISEKYGNYRCPECNTSFMRSSFHYCPQCGQMLDWSGLSEL